MVSGGVSRGAKKGRGAGRKRKGLVSFLATGKRNTRGRICLIEGKSYAIGGGGDSLGERASIKDHQSGSDFP